MIGVLAGVWYDGIMEETGHFLGNLYKRGKGLETTAVDASIELPVIEGKATDTLNTAVSLSKDLSDVLFVLLREVASHPKFASFRWVASDSDMLSNSIKRLQILYGDTINS